MYVCYPSSLGGRDWENNGFRPGYRKKFTRSYLNIKEKT
jgi:hypothetical protein